jgi:hypothetical protein
LPGVPGALYRPDGDSFVPSELTRGPWHPDHQHAGPPAALLSRAIARASGIPGGHTTRIAFDILRPVPLAPLTVEARVLRPGARVEQAEAVLAGPSGAPLMRATAWRMRAGDSGAVATPEPPPAAPEAAGTSGFDAWPRDDAVAYRDALDWRWLTGSFGAPGPAAVWSRLRGPLVAGEEPAPLERLLVMVDAASGVSRVLDWNEWLFVNVDLTVHLERPPQGEWIGMDARTRIGDAGAGVCTSVLSDERGRVGVSAQSLLVERR